jgi:hypothetical protein
MHHFCSVLFLLVCKRQALHRGHALYEPIAYWTAAPQTYKYRDLPPLVT